MQLSARTRKKYWVDAERAATAKILCAYRDPFPAAGRYLGNGRSPLPHPSAGCALILISSLTIMTTLSAEMTNRR